MIISRKILSGALGVCLLAIAGAGLAEAEDAPAIKQQQPAPAIPAAPETQPVPAAQSAAAPQAVPVPQTVPAPMDHLLTPPKPEQVMAFADDLVTPQDFTGVVVNLQEDKVMEFLAGGEVKPDDTGLGKWYALADLTLPDNILNQPKTQKLKKESEAIASSRIYFNAMVRASGVLATKNSILFWTLCNDRVLRLCDEAGHGCLLVLGPEAKPSAQFIDPVGDYPGGDSPWRKLFGRLPKIGAQDVVLFSNRPESGSRSAVRNYVAQETFTTCLQDGLSVAQLSAFGGDMNPFVFTTKAPDSGTQNYRNQIDQHMGERNDSVACDGVLVTGAGSVVFWKFAGSFGLCLMDTQYHTAVILAHPPGYRSPAACFTQFPVDDTMWLSSISRNAVLQGQDWPEGKPFPLDRDKAVQAAWRGFLQATGARDPAGWRTGLVSTTALGATKFKKWYYTVRFINQTTPGADATLYVGMDGTTGEIDTVEDGMKKINGMH